MAERRPNILRPRGGILDEAERGCGCPACIGANGWRREHASRVWQAMQATCAVASAFASGWMEGSIHCPRGDIDWAGVDMTKWELDLDRTGHLDSHEASRG